MRLCSLTQDLLIATILPAELMAIRLAFSYVAELEPDKYILCTDSLNAMICIENLIVKNILVQKIQELCLREMERGVGISMPWIPSHMVIRGNDLADQAMIILR